MNGLNSSTAILLVVFLLNQKSAALCMVTVSDQ